MLSQGLIFVFAIIVICHGADIQWQAKVFTGDVLGAGTEAGVFLQITGEGDRKTAQVAIDSDGTKLDQDHTDTFVFNAQDVGAPTKLRVWHDNAGETPGWNLARIELTALNGEYGGTYYFMCDCWLATDQPVFGVERTIPVASMNWEARVKTTDIALADFDSEVWITITGDKGTSREIMLDSPGDDFERGETNVMQLKTRDIGKPTKIRLHTVHDDDWHLDQIILELENGGETYKFDCDCWLGRPGKTIKEVYLS